ncbi:uncharacterized protein LOC130591036 [Beta vulgaris subsp. vulgaris]|uniref:uncharacterized protein LOC130591036 n=1 Tax=Beta vulgaris subsp. vulgaris TaxID=3555 RepID=UPI0025474050|nr:uncharacterized protein LOC130591036 [Beta vulgaris subsp. vulgaris]
MSTTFFNIPCYKFKPTVEEIFTECLKPKICGKKLPPEYPITEVNLYACHPYELFKDMVMKEDREEERIRYVFTELKKVSSKLNKVRNNQRRIVGVGTWKGERPDEIIDEDGKVFAYDRYFKFVPEPKKEDSNSILMVEGEWRMHEYSFHPDFLQQLQVEIREFVLCRITMKVKGNSRAKNKRGCRGLIYVRKPPASSNVMMEPPAAAAAAVQETIEQPTYHLSCNVAATTSTTMEELGESMEFVDSGKSLDIIVDDTMKEGDGNNATTDHRRKNNMGEDMEVHDNVNETASSSDLSCYAAAATTTVEEVGESMDIIVDDTMEGDQRNCETVPEDNLHDIDFGFQYIEFKIVDEFLRDV